jgi:hypothetical protein
MSGKDKRLFPERHNRCDLEASNVKVVCNFSCEKEKEVPYSYTSHVCPSECCVLKLHTKLFFLPLPMVYLCALVKLCFQCVSCVDNW